MRPMPEDCTAVSSPKPEPEPIPKEADGTDLAGTPGLAEGISLTRVSSNSSSNYAGGALPAYVDEHFLPKLGVSDATIQISLDRSVQG